MRTRTSRTLAVAAAVAALTFSATGTASAASLPNVTLKSGDGDTLRARFYEHANFTGAVITYYGSSPCTATTTDADYSLSSLPSGWNDKISAVRDYNSCDVKLYRDVNFGGGATAWVNYGSGKQVPSGWNDVTSSLRVS